MRTQSARFLVPLPSAQGYSYHAKLGENMSRLYALLIAFVVSAPAFGQIIYEPAQYQYCCAGQTYYYGGSNPYVIDFANRHALTEYYRPTPFNGYTVRQHVPVYTDLLPYRDAAAYGLTPEFAA